MFTTLFTAHSALLHIPPAKSELFNKTVNDSLKAQWTLHKKTQQMAIKHTYSDSRRRVFGNLAIWINLSSRRPNYDPMCLGVSHLDTLPNYRATILSFSSITGHHHCENKRPIFKSFIDGFARWHTQERPSWMWFRIYKGFIVVSLEWGLFGLWSIRNSILRWMIWGNWKKVGIWHQLIILKIFIFQWK